MQKAAKNKRVVNVTFVYTGTLMSKMAVLTLSLEIYLNCAYLQRICNTLKKKRPSKCGSSIIG